MFPSSCIGFETGYRTAQYAQILRNHERPLSKSCARASSSQKIAAFCNRNSRGTVQRYIKQGRTSVSVYLVNKHEP